VPIALAAAHQAGAVLLFTAALVACHRLRGAAAVPLAGLQAAPDGPPVRR